MKNFRLFLLVPLICVAFLGLQSAAPYVFMDDHPRSPVILFDSLSQHHESRVQTDASFHELGLLYSLCNEVTMFCSDYDIPADVVFSLLELESNSNLLVYTNPHHVGPAQLDVSALQGRNHTIISYAQLVAVRLEQNIKAAGMSQDDIDSHPGLIYVAWFYPSLCNKSLIWDYKSAQSNKKFSVAKGFLSRAKVLQAFSHIHKSKKLNNVRIINASGLSVNRQILAMPQR